MISLPTKDGSIWVPQGLLWAKWCAVYGASFVTSEAQKAELWLLSNPERGKTERGMPRFFNGWLARAPKPPAQPGIAPETYQAIPRDEIDRMRRDLNMPPLVIQ